MFAGHENGAVGRHQGARGAGGQRTSGESALFALSIGPHGLTQYSDNIGPQMLDLVFNLSMIIDCIL